MQLTLRSDGTASHRSAAALLGLIDWLPEPEVTVRRLAHYRGSGRITVTRTSNVTTSNSFKASRAPTPRGR
jgi:hypothetical protein